MWALTVKGILGDKDFWSGWEKIEWSCFALRGVLEGQLDWEEKGHLCMGLAGPKWLRQHVCCLCAHHHYSMFPSAQLPSDWSWGLAACSLQPAVFYQQMRETPTSEPEGIILLLPTHTDGNPSAGEAETHLRDSGRVRNAVKFQTSLQSRCNQNAGSVALCLQNPIKGRGIGSCL